MPEDFPYLHVLAIDENHVFHKMIGNLSSSNQDDVEAALLSAMDSVAASARISADVVVAIRSTDMQIRGNQNYTYEPELADVVGLAWEPEFPRPSEFGTALDNANFFGYLQNLKRRAPLAPLTLTVEDEAQAIFKNYLQQLPDAFWRSHIWHVSRDSLLAMRGQVTA